ncbi:hypothetical protein J4E91_003105 [Alternaria rosae]|nr:hypothetical protein J4E91_003105 [Alternaria rosae]
MWAEVNGERKKVACCERVVINYTIPKASECACPSERAAPTATVAGNSRIQKGRRKSAAVTPYNLEKAIQAGFDAKTDASSITYTPSETSGSNAASLPSSASSTPRLLPAQNEPVSSCCKSKPFKKEVVVVAKQSLHQRQYKEAAVAAKPKQNQLQSRQYRRSLVAQRSRKMYPSTTSHTLINIWDINSNFQLKR